MIPRTFRPSRGLRHSVEWRLNLVGTAVSSTARRLMASCGCRLRYRRLRSLKPDNDERLSGIKNICHGERCFIVGTAPSLRNMDLSLLKGEKTFALNKGFDLSALGGPTPFGYVICDPTIARDYADEIDLEGIPNVFVSSAFPEFDLTNAAEPFVYDVYEYPKMHEGFVSDDIRDGVYDSHSVAHHAVQIAAYMGFAEIYVIGVDLDFDPANLHYYGSSKREVDDSRRHSIPWSEKMIDAFGCAGRHLTQRGISLVNAGVGGKLDSIPRTSFESLFGTAGAQAR